ncbi:hypothetical protein PV325_011129, partial [Microctonus aethiopoides]
EICMKYKMMLPVYEKKNADSGNNYIVRCTVENIIEEATARNKQKAKQNSAKQMIQRLTDLNLIHDDKKNVEITGENRKDLLIPNSHKTFGNSFDITRRQKFQLYYKSLKIDETECTTEHLECILENISKILDIKIAKSITMSETNKFYVYYTFNKSPPFEQIGVGKDYNEALKSALICTIKKINLLFS